jgi:hypothetical protein
MLIPLFLCLVGCDDMDTHADARLFGDRVQEAADAAGLPIDQLSVLRPADEEVADEGREAEALDDLALLTVTGLECSFGQIQSCEITCGIVGQLCAACLIADDGRPAFLCAGTLQKPKKY